MTTTQRTIPSNPAFVPVEPFRRLINDWLDVQMAAWPSVHDNSRSERMQFLYEIVFPDAPAASAKRKLYSLLNEQREMHFDTADRIVCKLFGNPGLWSSDPELAAIYDNVNLLAIDAAKPTCEEAKQLLYERVRQTFRRCDRNESATARKLGLPKSYVGYVIAGPPRRVAA